MRGVYKNARARYRIHLLPTLLPYPGLPQLFNKEADLGHASQRSAVLRKLNEEEGKGLEYHDVGVVGTYVGLLTGRERAIHHVEKANGILPPSTPQHFILNIAPHATPRPRNYNCRATVQRWIYNAWGRVN